MKKIIFAVALATMVTGCGGMQFDKYEDIPAGHVAKVLTPKGWQKGVIEAGQVNLGGEDRDGRRNTLVFLEATAVQVKEKFALNKGVDNRIMTSGKDGTGQIPVTVDVYIRLRVPADAKLQNRVYAEITPRTLKGKDGRVKLIKVEDVYERYAMQEARSLIRQIVGAYINDIDINTSRQKIESDMTKDLLERLEKLKVPLELQSVSLSNVAADSQIQDSRNNSSGADAEVEAISRIGVALRNNPGYVELRKVQAMEKVASEAAKAGKPPTFIIGIDGDAAHAYAANQ